VDSQGAFQKTFREMRNAVRSIEFMRCENGNVHFLKPFAYTTDAAGNKEADASAEDVPDGPDSLSPPGHVE